MLEIDALPLGSLNSEPWIFLFCISLFFYYTLKKSYLQIGFILLLSLIFAFAANQYSIAALGSIVGATFINFIFYKTVNKSQFILWLAIIFNVLLLFFAKYFIFGTSLLSIETNLKDTTVLFLFAGLSFFVFSMIATLVEASKNGYNNINISIFFTYALFFPRIIMGPIMKLSEFASQVIYKTPTDENLKYGIFLFMIGFAKKTMADFLFLYPNLVFSTPDGYAGSVHIITFYAYAAQLYLDFSGYTDMALGLALMFGYTLPNNFNRPYLSTSITEFWQKWHITLSNWLKYHIYIPMGGSKNGLTRLYFALFMTFIVSGVWHGVGLNYLLWGLWHGIAIAIHKTWKNFGTTMPTFFGWVLTFHFVVFGWILFIYNSFNDINNVLNNILYNFDISIVPSVFISNVEWSICFFISWILILSPNSFMENLKKMVFNAHWLIHILLILVVFYASIFVKTIVVAPFIYENF